VAGRRERYRCASKGGEKEKGKKKKKGRRKARAEGIQLSGICRNFKVSGQGERGKKEGGAAASKGRILLIGEEREGRGLSSRAARGKREREKKQSRDPP